MICPPVGTPAQMLAQLSVLYLCGSQRSLWFSVGLLCVESGILRAFLYCSDAGTPDDNSDGHDLDHPLPALHGRHRVKADDRL